MMSFSQYCLVICATACLCLDTDALAQDGAEVLDNLKRYDSIYESGFTVSATRKNLEHLITGQAINVERRWRLAFEGDRCGYLRELIEYEKPKFREPQEGDRYGLLDGWMYTTLRRRQWGYWGSDASGMHCEDMSLKISPENEIVQIGTIYNSILFGPKDAGPNVAKRTVLWSLGRFFSQNIDEVTLVKPSTDGRLTVSALGSKGKGWPGRWELEIEPAAAWMVREARFYHDIRPDAINCEMKNSGTTWSDPYCIPQYAQFNYGSSIKGGRARAEEDLSELTFDSAIEQFDEKLYEAARQAVIEKRPPKLTITDFRMSPPLIFQPDELSGIASDIALENISANALSDEGFAGAKKVVARPTEIHDLNADSADTPRPDANSAVVSVNQPAIVSTVAQRPWYRLSLKWAVVVLILAGVTAGCACIFLFGSRRS